MYSHIIELLAKIQEPLDVLISEIGIQLNQVG